MENRDHLQDPRIAHFWARYTDTLKLFRIPARSIPWYRKHIQAFIHGHPDTRLREHTVETVENWLGRLGREPHVSEWQFRQNVDALRLLFCHFLKLPWVNRIDWELWSSGAKSLEESHPTVARTYEMIEKAVKNPDNRLGKAHPDLYRRFLAAIRVPDYSPNTEKSYLGWINRFVSFHGRKHPCDCKEPEVASFLEHLTVNRKVSVSTQSQALNALVFFFARVLERPLGQIGPSSRLPVLTRSLRDIGMHGHC